MILQPTDGRCDHEPPRLKRVSLDSDSKARWRLRTVTRNAWRR